MHPLENTIFKLIRARDLIQPGDHLVVGVSGGADSMALLTVLARLASALDIGMAVAHADHGLRPDAAHREADLVRRWASALNIACHTKSLDVPSHAKQHRQSIEAAARELRYDFFDGIAAKVGANKIAVAHTADDQAEEVLLRMIRGAGRKGLSGMSLLREGRLVRPMLGIERRQILAYLSDNDVPFAEDPSNQDRRYLRNKIRLDLLPYLKTFNPDIAGTLRQTAGILQEEDALLDTLAQEQYALIVTEDVTPDRPMVAADRSMLNQLPVAIARRVIEKMLIRAHAQPRFTHIESIRRIATAERGQIHLNDGLRVQTLGPHLRLFYPWGKRPCRFSLAAAQPLFSVQIIGPGVYPIPEAGCTIRIEEIPSRSGRTCAPDNSALLLDADKAPYPLVIRNRLPGDTMRPADRQNHRPQKVSAILSDKKIPLAQRDQIPIILSGKKIVAVVGVCIDAEATATADSTTLFRVTANPI